MAAQNPRQADLWQALGALKTRRVFPQGSTLFQRGSPARGVYRIEKGEVRVLLPSSAHAQPAFEMAGPGAVLGLSESMSGVNHKLTALAASHTEVSYVDGQDLMNFLGDHRECCMQIVRLLSENLHALYHKFRVVGGVAVRARKKPTSVRRIN